MGLQRKKERGPTNWMTFPARSRGNDSRAPIRCRGSVFVHEGRKNEGNRRPRVGHLLYWGTSCMYRRYIFTSLSPEWWLQRCSSCRIVRCFHGKHRILCFLRHFYLFCRSNDSCFRRAFLQQLPCTVIRVSLYQASRSPGCDLAQEQHLPNYH